MNIVLLIYCKEITVLIILNKIFTWVNESILVYFNLQYNIYTINIKIQQIKYLQFY